MNSHTSLRCGVGFVPHGCLKKKKSYFFGGGSRIVHELRELAKQSGCYKVRGVCGTCKNRDLILRGVEGQEGGGIELGYKKKIDAQKWTSRHLHAMCCVQASSLPCVRQVILDCSEANAPFYKKCGFEEKARQMAIYF